MIKFVRLNPLCIVCFLVLLPSCVPNNKPKHNDRLEHNAVRVEHIIVDCNYTFDEAVAGTPAPQRIINELVLLNVRYISTDGRVHAGQLLTNKKIASELAQMFQFMLKIRFPIVRVVPVVKYGWSDEASMQANNTYSFCYRNVGYSKHATGMAVDINPFFNPLRWKAQSINRPNRPLGAHYNPKVPGTFRDSHPVVNEFLKKGFRWGRNFTRFNDDHHFEKKYR